MHAHKNCVSDAAIEIEPILASSGHHTFLSYCELGLTCISPVTNIIEMTEIIQICYDSDYFVGRHLHQKINDCPKNEAMMGNG